eukprot:7377828-Prymnesium_polylepis.1
MHLDGTFRCMLDVWKARKLEASGTLGRRESGASIGLYRTGDTRVGRRPVSSQLVCLSAFCNLFLWYAGVAGYGSRGRNVAPEIHARSRLALRLDVRGGARSVGTDARRRAEEREERQGWAEDLSNYWNNVLTMV